jgi:hypothetical protein
MIQDDLLRALIELADNKEILKKFDERILGLAGNIKEKLEGKARESLEEEVRKRRCRFFWDLTDAADEFSSATMGRDEQFLWILRKLMILGKYLRQLKSLTTLDSASKEMPSAEVGKMVGQGK